MLCKSRSCISPIFSKKFRQEYYERLQAVRDRGDWESWLQFFLRGIIEVSAQATETARAILSLREEHRTLVTGRMGRAAGNGHRVLDHFYKKPIVSVVDVQELTETTYPAANQLVEKFVSLGILAEFTGNKRHRRFRYQSYIKLFAE